VIEIETETGIITASSSALAEAMAELLAAEAEHRASEDDLLAAVSIELDEVPAQRGAPTAAA
jgi:hypothetical protein